MAAQEWASLLLFAKNYVVLLGETVLSNEDPDDLVIAEGAASTTAYARLQFESLNPTTRVKINEALLRYCFTHCDENFPMIVRV